MNTETLATDTPERFAAAVDRAAELLRAGEVVALPTETVYGLAANALEAKAVAKLFSVKGRPANNPIIVHVASLPMAQRCVTAWPTAAGKLARAFWPGPLTLVLPRAREIPERVAAGGRTVGVRWPAHPLVQAVIRACDFPLAAPSANLSGQLSPTTAGHVARQLGGTIPLVVDGGPCPVGIESTVLDLTVAPARILRPGMIHTESLSAVLGEIGQSNSARHAPTLRSPGLLEQHYAPKARLMMLSWRDEEDLQHQLLSRRLPPGVGHIIAHTQVPAGERFGPVSVIPHDAEAFARALYAELHRCDEAGAMWIVVERPPASPAWAGIADRLRRAAASAPNDGPASGPNPSGKSR